MDKFYYHVVVNVKEPIDDAILEKRLKSILGDKFDSIEVFFGSLRPPQTANICIVLNTEGEVQDIKQQLQVNFTEFKSVYVEPINDLDNLKKQYVR